VLVAYVLNLMSNSKLNSEAHLIDCVANLNTLQKDLIVGHKLSGQSLRNCASQCGVSMVTARLSLFLGFWNIHRQFRRLGSPVSRTELSRLFANIRRSEAPNGLGDRISAYILERPTADRRDQGVSFCRSRESDRFIRCMPGDRTNRGSARE
jgi:hypothetical protein